MEQRMKATLIQLKTSEMLSFVRVISYTKFGYNAFFQSNSTEGSEVQFKRKYYDVYAFSKSLLQINNLKDHIEEIINIYSKLNNNRILCPIVERIEQKDMVYLVCQVEKYSLKQLIAKREGLTEYEVTFFIMEIFQIINYCKSRQIYFEKVELTNFYLNEDMKLSIPFNMFLNKASCMPLMKRLPFRNQAKNRNNCPDLFSSFNFEKNNDSQQVSIQSEYFLQQKRNLININLVSSWNLGVLVYQLFENSKQEKPFETNCLVPIINHRRNDSRYKNDEIFHQNENKKCYFIRFNQTQSVEAKQLIVKLLQIDIKKRLNFPLILIQPLFKKLSPLPHILPFTILTCPPSEQFKNQFKNKFSQQNLSKKYQSNQDSQSKFSQIVKKNQHSRTRVSTNTFNHLSKSKQFENSCSQNLVDSVQNSNPEPFAPLYQTQKYIKEEERSLTQTKIYVEEFIDISNVFGYGYQMNTGTLCFVFNDETEFYFPNANRKYFVYVNSKKGQTVYTYDKLPEEEDLKKKIFILEAFSKSIKKFKILSSLSNSGQNQKTITVLKYGKTKHASVFHLSNDSVQVLFNDKICFLTTKTSLYVMGKNNEKYEKYDYKNETSEMKTRRDYVSAMAKKIFHWTKADTPEDIQMIEQKKQNKSKKTLNHKNSIIELEEHQNQFNQNSDYALQSLKKIKQKKQKSYHMMKKQHQKLLS